MIDRLLDFATLAIYAFGALAFSVLSIYYWRERLRRSKPGKSSVFPVFTLVCAAAFLNSLLLSLILQNAGSPWGAWLIRAGRLIIGVLPPLMLHLVYELERGGDSHDLRGRRIWKWSLIAFYVASIGGTWSDSLSSAPYAMLVASTAGVLLPAFSRRQLQARERVHRRWIRSLLVLMAVSEAAILGGFGPFVEQMPDYLLLAFFCVSLYYRERLVFFDLLVKRGVFFGVGLLILTLCFALGAPPEANPWLYALGMLAFWLAGPWVKTLVARVVDRVWLRRPYSAPNAEFQFIRDIQSAATEDELRARAAGSLSGIFRTAVEVGFGPSPVPAAGDSAEDCLVAALEHNTEHGGAPLGSLVLTPRPNGIPFLSDDRRLLQSLAGTLGVMLENIRFRADRRRQEQLEQRLRWLASRAELKALRAQINPHFLFNALSAIAGLMHYRPELAEATIEMLAQVFRYTLRKSENEWTPLGEEVDFVLAYLGVEQARFGERLQLEFDVAPEAALVPIPAMSIQPLIENAVKHGVSNVEGRVMVGLRAAVHDGFLTVEVRDDGPGFPPGFSLEGRTGPARPPEPPGTRGHPAESGSVVRESSLKEPGEGHGLRNVVERLRGCYGDAARLCWESGPTGTRVVLTVPQSAVFDSTGGDARDARSDCG